MRILVKNKKYASIVAKYLSFLRICFFSLKMKKHSLDKKNWVLSELFLNVVTTVDIQASNDMKKF